MTFTAIQYKSTKLSDQVQEILNKNGYSTVFNETEFKLYKKLTKNEFNQALAIAQMFVENSGIMSDFQEYIF